MKASYNGHLATTKLLLEEGAHIEAKDKVTMRGKVWTNV